MRFTMKNTVQINLTIKLFISAVFILSFNLNANDQKPNIVYILADDMGYGDVGFNGCKDIKTPVLDKLAKEGTILESFYAHGTCSPTRAALLTGRYPTSTGAYAVVKPNAPTGLPLRERTLAQALKDCGYETAIVGKWHIGESEEGFRPTRRGFDHQYGLWFGNVNYYTHQRAGVDDWYRNDKPLKEEGYATHLIANESCRLIRERDKKKPFFLYLSFNAVHDPYDAPEEYKKPYSHLPEARQIYAGMTAAMDEAIGQVYETLKEQKMIDNTLIVFSSDNGGPQPNIVTSNLPLRAKKATLYEGGVRVCAFVNWPGKIKADAVNKEALHIIDWYPTLVKLAGGSLKQPLPVDGLDIWPVLTQGSKLPRKALLLVSHPDKAALRMGDWKIAPNKKGNLQLFNLKDDIGETKNLAAEFPEKFKEMKDRLAVLMKDAAPQAGVIPGQAKKKKKRGKKKK